MALDMDELSLKNAELFQHGKMYAEREIYKTIFLLSTGTLVLSITFIGYLKTDFVYPWVLISSWLFLSLAIAGNVTLHWLTSIIDDKKLDHVNKSRKENYRPDWTVRINEDKDITQLSKWAFTIRRWTMGFLMLGLIALLCFAGINLLFQAALKDETLGSKGYPSESKTLPSMPDTGFKPH